MAGGRLGSFRRWTWRRRDTDSAYLQKVTDDYRTYLIARASPDTVRSYLSVLNIYAQWCSENERPVIRASDRELQLFVGDQLQRHAQATAMNRLLALRNFYAFLVTANYRRDNPTAGIPIRRDLQEPEDPFTVRELERLLECCKNPRERALLLFSIGSGARRAEIAAIRHEDIDWDEGTVRIRRGKGGRERKCAPGLKAMDAVRQYANGANSGPLWVMDSGKAMTGKDWYRVLKQIAKRARVVNVHPHRFRVTADCQLLEAGADTISVGYVLGQTVQTVQRYQRATETKRALSQQRHFSLADRVVG